MLNANRNKGLIIAFLIPSVLLYLALMVSPVLLTTVLSFFKWTGVGGSENTFVGFANYLKVFSDSTFWASVGRLCYFVLLSLIFQLVIGFILAYLVSLKLKGSKFFKLSFFLPVVLSMTAVSLMWKMILDRNNGMLNALLKAVGLGSLVQSWLTNPKLSFTVISLVDQWLCIGTIFVILLAGILTVPSDLYEAADIDGVGAFRRIFTITIPMIKNVMGVCSVLALSGAMKTFDVFFIMTNGSFGPNNMNMIPMGLMYNMSFQRSDFGRASVIALFVMVTGAVLSAFVYFKGFKDEA